MREKVVLPQLESVEIIDRVKPTCPPEWYRPFEDNKSGVPLMATFGDGYRYHITGLTHDDMGFPTTKPDEVNALMQRHFRKIRQGFDDILLYENFLMEDATSVIVAYGAMYRTAKTAVLDLRKEGHKIGLLKLTTIWPFPKIAFENMPDQVEELFVPEMNMGQLFREVVRVNRGKRLTHKINKVTGELMTPEEIVYKIKRKGA